MRYAIVVCGKTEIPAAPEQYAAVESESENSQRRSASERCNAGHAQIGRGATTGENVSRYEHFRFHVELQTSAQETGEVGLIKAMELLSIKPMTSTVPELLSQAFTLVSEEGVEILIPLYALMTWS